MKNPFESILNDTEIIEELKNKVASKESAVTPFESGLEANLSVDSDIEFPSGDFTEAIIMNFGRPALLVNNNSYVEPESEVWKSRLSPFKVQLESSIKSVGRVELINHTSFDWIGTGFLLEGGIVVTNRHVAAEFAERKGRRFRFLRNAITHQEISAKIDFRQEYDVNIEAEFDIAEVLHIEAFGNQYPDLALLKVKEYSGLPKPLELQFNAQDDDYVAVIGYPARDSRNDSSTMLRIFRDIYNVKRLAPGQITNFSNGDIFTHDCSTLGGNSGSVVVSIDDGKAVGLHFGGRFQTANYAVKAKIIQERISSLRNLSVAFSENRPEGDNTDELEEAPRLISEYAGRKGFNPEFIGSGELRVELPMFGEAQLVDVAPVNPVSENHGEGILDYTNFSLALSKKRGLAYFTAVNIDGNSLHRIPRGRDRWYIDPRVAREHQRDNRLYRGNDLDRGHLVRRLDPMWGTRTQAKKAQEDSFHYSNASPQHKDLNRRIWLDLEDYILDNSESSDLKISVFTGPVFNDDVDELYRDVQIPQAFWKIACYKREDDSLSATAYLLSQKHMLNLEFAFGGYHMYQVSISELQTLTGLNFSDLIDNDPIQEGTMGRESVRMKAIVDITDIRL